MLLPATSPPLAGIFRVDPRARAAYAEGAGIYRIVPAAVALPADPSDLRALIEWAAASLVPLVPRGAGSAMGGGNVGDGVIIDLTSLPQRLEIRPERRLAITSAGVTLDRLNTAAAAHGLRLPPDPSSGRWVTLGGMVSTNAAGARSLRYGSVRRWVDALTLLTADGETLTLQRGEAPDSRSAAVARFSREAEPAIRAAAGNVVRRFPRTTKNSSGYALDAWLRSGDLLDLVIGAEGTLGIVTDVAWRLDRVPPCRAALRVALASLDALAPAVAALLPFSPSAVELLDRTFLELVGASVDEAMLLVELERDDEATLVAATHDAALALSPHTSAVETALTPEDAGRLWALRHAASPILAGLSEQRRSLQVIEDGCVPVARMGDYVRAVRAAGERYGIQVVLFGHAGDGHVHVNLLPDVGRPGWETAVAGLLADVTETVVRLGGTPSGEHGDGRLRAGFLRALYGEEIVALFRLVKRAFDPAGLFNPGIVLPSGEPPLSRLKVGDGACELPPDIARALRDIERQGGYARCRLDLADPAAVPLTGPAATHP